MAAENISLNITGNALQQLQKIEAQVGKVAGTFGKLKAAIGGIAIGTLITNAVRMAEAFDDISKATDVAISSVIGFGQAVQANGGSIEGANNAILKLSQTIGEAKDGSKTAITAFNEIGISLNDLATLSQQEILQKTINGLGQITDKSKQARLSVELLGKGIKGVDLTGTAQDFAGAVKNAEKYADSNKSAADAAQNLQNIQAKLTQELLLTLQPISDLIKRIDAGSESFMKMVNAIKYVVIALAGLFVVVRIGSAIIAFIRILKAFVDNIRTVGVVIRGPIEFFKEWFKWTGKVKDAIKETLKVKDWRKAAGLEPDKSLDDQVEQLGKIGTAIDNIKKFALGAAAGLYAMTAGLIGFNNAADKSDRKRTAGRPGGGRGSPNTDQQIADFEKLQKAYTDGKQKVDDYTASLQRELNQVAENINLQTKYLKVSQNEAEVLQAQEEIINKIADARLRYAEMLQGLDPKNENDKRLIEYIKGQIAALKGKEEAGKAAAKAAVEGLQQERAALEEVNKQIELMKQQLTDDAAIKALRDQIALIQLYGDELENANIALEVSQSLEQALLSLRQQELDLIAKKGQLTQEQFDREMAQIEALRQAAYKRAGDEIDAKTDVQQAQRIADEDATLSIKKYLDELEKGVTPAKQSLESVQSVFGNMNSALETFVRSGKFKFKDFALSVIQDLLLIQAKAAMTKIFSAIIGGIFPGLAEGGPAKKGQPYIVGEKGPELFVPNTGGTVVPNNAMNKGMSTGAVNAPIQNTYITNNINAVDAKSVAQLFAENRKTLLGTVRMAEKEMPYMGRT